MTKKIVLGAGTLTFTNSVNGKVHTEKVTAFAVDQTEKAKSVVETYRKAYPELTKIAREHGLFDPMVNPPPYTLDDTKEVFDKMVAVDFGKVEARMLGHMAEAAERSTRSGRWTGARISFPKSQMPRLDVCPGKFKVTIPVKADMAAAFYGVADVIRASAREAYDRRIMMALFGPINLDEPEPLFPRERRIWTLLSSRDRRQIKRGERLFKRWSATRTGYNLQGAKEERLRSFYNTQLGETYLPENYAKD